MPAPRANPALRLAAAAILPGLLATASAAAPRPAADLAIHFLNVDQGNAALVVGPDGTRVLIDAGNVGKGAGVLAPYLQSIGVLDLDYSIMTHWDLDHYGGMPELFTAGWKPNSAAWDVGNAYADSGSIASQYLSSVSGVRAVPPLGATIALGDGATLEVVAVAGATPLGTVDISGSCQIDNSSSIAVVIRYGDFDCWIAGDLTAGGTTGQCTFTADVEGPASAYVGQVEVALASHHGSNTSSSAAVVANLSPSLVVQSAGLDNEFFHPTKTVVNRWNSPSAARVQWCTTEGDTDNGSGSFTGVNGHVVVRADGLRFTAAKASSNDSLRFTTHENPGKVPIGLSLRVAEVLVDPVGAPDAVGEWLELQNVSLAGPVDLYGVRIESGSSSFTIASRILLGHGERIAIGVEGRRSANGNYFSHLGAPWEDFALANGPSSLVVRAQGGASLETVTWGGAGVPVVPGKSAERVDLFSGPSAANFAPAAAAWAGGDFGSPGKVNAADASDWPVVLSVDPPPLVGGELTFELHALDEPLNYYLLGAALGFLPGVDVLGLHWDLNPDAVLLAFLGFPDVFALLGVDGRATVTYPIPSNPSLAGKSFWTEFLTLQFSFQTFSFQGVSKSNLAFFTIQ